MTMEYLGLRERQKIERKCALPRRRGGGRVSFVFFSQGRGVIRPLRG